MAKGRPIRPRLKDSGHYLAWVTGKNVRVSMVHDLQGVIGRPRGPRFEVVARIARNASCLSLTF